MVSSSVSEVGSVSGVIKPSCGVVLPDSGVMEPALIGVAAWFVFVLSSAPPIS